MLGKKSVTNFYYVHQVYHLAEGKDRSQCFFDEELDEHQPFPTLHQALDSLDPHVGFNVEIKWTMQRKVCLAYCTESRSDHWYANRDKSYHSGLICGYRLFKIFEEEKIKFSDML
jgi:hypothetical protein